MLFMTSSRSHIRSLPASPIVEMVPRPPDSRGGCTDPTSRQEACQRIFGQVLWCHQEGAV